MNKSMKDNMMLECKGEQTLVWCMITHSREKEWVGYYKKGIGNNMHKTFAIDWSGSLSAHLQYFLLCWGFDGNGINQLIKQSFSYHAIVDATYMVQNKQSKIVSKSQTAAEQKLAAFDQKNTWFDISLGCTPSQQIAHDQALAAHTAGGGQYNFNEDLSVDSVAHRDGDTVFTTTRDKTLGPTVYKVTAKADSIDSEENMAFFQEGFEEEEEGGSCCIQMNVVHQEEARAAGASTCQTTEEGHKPGAGSQNSTGKPQSAASMVVPNSVLRKDKTPKATTRHRSVGRGEHECHNNFNGGISGMHNSKITEDVIPSAPNEGILGQQQGANNRSAQPAFNETEPTVTFQLNWWLLSNY